MLPLGGLDLPLILFSVHETAHLEETPAFLKDKEMKKIKAKTSEVLLKLEKNRAKHREVFEAALEGYRVQAIAAFKKNIQDAKDGKPFWRHLSLERPQDHTEDYDLAIRMLKWHEEECVELDGESMQHFVMDDWGWKEHFVSNTSKYTT